MAADMKIGRGDNARISEHEKSVDPFGKDAFVRKISFEATGAQGC